MGTRGGCARWCAVGAAGALLLACGESREDTDPASTSIGSLSTTAAATTADPASTGGDDGGESGDKLDVGGGMPTGSAGDLPGSSCKKVDLLFVIDSSGSMADEQSNLVSAFPGFIDTMREELAETDGYNIGVVRTDANDISCVPNRYGALVVRNYAVGSSNATCTPYASGLRFMTQDDDLYSKFACAARVGTGGDGDERPAQALVSALTPPNSDAGDCNEGFLRDDALLVVVIITDEEDDHESDAEACNSTPLPGSDGEPADWYDAVVGAKGGIEGNVVVLSLIGPTGAEACPPLDKCNDAVTGAEPAPRLEQFTTMFTHGFVGQVCGDYEPFFAEAIATIKSACDEFTPPG